MAAYASAIDNVTNDSRTLLPQWVSGMAAAKRRGYNSTLIEWSVDGPRKDDKREIAAGLRWQ